MSITGQENSWRQRRIATAYPVFNYVNYSNGSRSSTNRWISFRPSVLRTTTYSVYKYTKGV